MTASSVHYLVCSGRITARQGALLLELRRRLAWLRRPWWERCLIIAARLVLDWPEP